MDAKKSSVWQHQDKDTHPHACTDGVVYLAYTVFDEDVGKDPTPPRSPLFWGGAIYPLRGRLGRLRALRGLRLQFHDPLDVLFAFLGNFYSPVPISYALYVAPLLAALRHVHVKTVVFGGHVFRSKPRRGMIWSAPARPLYCFPITYTARMKRFTS